MLAAAAKGRSAPARLARYGSGRAAKWSVLRACPIGATVTTVDMVIGGVQPARPTHERNKNRCTLHKKLSTINPMLFCKLLLLVPIRALVCSATPSAAPRPTERVMLVTVSDDRFGRKGGRYRETQLRVQQLFEGWDYGITDFFMWTHENTTKTEVYRQNQQLFDDIVPDMNGRAYKPLAIYHGLATLSEGDFLIYADVSPARWAGFEFKKLPAIYDVNALKKLVRQNGDILTSFVFWHYEDKRLGASQLIKKGYLKNVQFPKKPKDNYLPTDLGEHTHAYFTTDKCIDAMGLQRYRDSYQHDSGMVILRKSARSEQFVSRWLHWNLNTDCATIIPFQHETDRKIGHRTDQSISGLLINEMNVSLLIPVFGTGRNPYNFLQWSLAGVDYKFINSNADPRQTRWHGWRAQIGEYREAAKRCTNPDDWLVLGEQRWNVTVQRETAEEEQARMRNILRQALRNLSRIGMRLEDTDPPKGAGQRHGVSNAASSNMFESPVLRSAFEQARKARARSNAARARVGRSPGVVGLH